MPTLLEILKKTADFFARKGLEHPRLQAELLLAAALGCKRLDLYLQFERPLEEPILEQLRDWVRRRAAREPLQYIIGETDFRELTLRCDPRALIPRPETEELLDHVFTALPANATRVLDLGTGTGAIALSLAYERPALAITATDRSRDALALAEENAQRLQLAARVSFAQSDWLDAIEGVFSAIVSNPPYLTAEELSSAAPEVSEHEPHSALVAAKEGLADLQKILASAPDHLEPGGFVAMETGIAHHAALTAFAGQHGYARTQSLPDLSGRDRFFFAWMA